MTIFGCKAFSPTQAVMWTVQRHFQHLLLEGTHESPCTHAGPYLMLSVLLPLEPRKRANLRAKGVYMN